MLVILWVPELFLLIELSASEEKQQNTLKNFIPKSLLNLNVEREGDCAAGRGGSSRGGARCALGGMPTPPRALDDFAHQFALLVTHSLVLTNGTASVPCRFRNELLIDARVKQSGCACRSERVVRVET